MPDIEQLQRAVYENPDANEPREALGHALTAASDPRGEFIRLQLDAARTGKYTREARSREKALLSAHASGWLAPLRSALVARSVKWERGFPVGGRLAFQKTAEASEALVGLPALATLTTLDVGSGNVVRNEGFLRRFLFQSPLRGLRVLTGVRRAFFSDFLQSEPPWALERLAFECEGGGGPSGEARQRLEVERVARLAAEQVGLPRLTDLSLSYAHRIDPAGNYGWLWGTAFGRRLRVLRMNHDPAGILPWLPALVEHGEDLALERVVFFTVTDFDLEHTEAGWTRLTGKFPKNPPFWLKGTLERAIRDIRESYPLEVAIKGFDPGDGAGS